MEENNSYFALIDGIPETELCKGSEQKLIFLEGLWVLAGKGLHYLALPARKTTLLLKY